MQKRLILLLALLGSLFSISAKYIPLDSLKVPEIRPLDTPWMISVQAANTYAFGDDSWNIPKDLDNAHGWSVSVNAGRYLSQKFAVRLNARYLQLFSRVNLEVLEAFKEDFPSVFPRDGFYSYNAAAIQAEAMLNVTNFFRRSNYIFNFYLIGGAGFNAMFNYSEDVDNWDGSYAPGLVYYVDKRTHVMPCVSFGGMLDFRITTDLSLNLEALSVFTADKMEGVKYDEFYDVYITLALGVTLHF